MMIAVCQHLSTRVVSSLVVLFDGGVGANYQPRHNSEIAAQNTSYRVYPSSGLSSPCHLFVCSKFDQTFCFFVVLRTNDCLECAQIWPPLSLLALFDISNFILIFFEYKIEKPVAILISVNVRVLKTVIGSSPTGASVREQEIIRA